MPYYTLPQTYSQTQFKNNDYSHVQNWNNNSNNHWNTGNWNKHFKGHHPQWWVNKWYPKWKFVNYRWQNNCWWVYIKYGNHWKTVCISQNFKWHQHWNGYRW